MKYAKNILKMYLQSNQFEREYGSVWYNTGKLSIKYCLSIKIVAGVMAILSPRNKWKRNIIDTETMIKAFKTYKTINSFKVSTLNANKNKAWLLLYTLDLTLIRGIKVSNFYANLLGNVNNVTIDTHAYNIASGKLKSVKTFTSVQYRDAEIAYQSVASVLNIAPRDLQAITWLAYKRVYNVACDWNLYQGKLF